MDTSLPNIKDDTATSKIGAKLNEKRSQRELQDLRPSRSEAEEAVRTLLRWIGEDITREGLIDTPKRVIHSYEEMFEGYCKDPRSELRACFKEVAGYDDMVLVRDIALNSVCEHHMLPVIGKVHIAYYPSDSVVGLSKLGRIVDLYGKRLQTQERVTAQIARAIDDALKPRGVAIMIDATHLCMTLRGVQKPNSSTMTSKFTGIFQENEKKDYFFRLLQTSRG